MTPTRSQPTHYDLLGLPVRFAVDLAEVERNYLARSRDVHPDYHQLGPLAEQRASMEQSAVLNEAYATLRQPFRRAEYLLGIEGGPSASEYKEMAPAFLDEMLDLRMEIEELREGGPADSLARLEMEHQLTRRSDALVQALTAAFARLEALPADNPNRRGVLLQIRQVLNAARFIQGLLRDLRAD
jgi:molecular chaperone HscB